MAKRARKYHKEATAHARLALQACRAYAIELVTADDSNNDASTSSDCRYTGGVHYSLPDSNSNSDSEFNRLDTDWECIFLPKYHCELNFIEFFWGAVKRYLRENCDYTFKTLNTNLPKAMDAVNLSTICLWEHRMHRWMEAYNYRSGLETKEAQSKVKEFSSKKYKSHRRVPETVVLLFD